jgi:hypothetical protein
MKRISVLTILMVSIAGFAMEERAVYLVLIAGCLSLIRISLLDIGRLRTTRTSMPTGPRDTAIGIERVGGSLTTGELANE